MSPFGNRDRQRYPNSHSMHLSPTATLSDCCCEVTCVRICCFCIVRVQRAAIASIGRSALVHLHWMHVHMCVALLSSSGMCTHLYTHKPNAHPLCIGRGAFLHLPSGRWSGVAMSWASYRAVIARINTALLQPISPPALSGTHAPPACRITETPVHINN